MFVFIHTLFCQVEAVGAEASQAFSDLKVQVLSATHAEVKNKDTKTEGEVSNIHAIRIHILESIYTACFIRLLVNSTPFSVFLSNNSNRAYLLSSTYTYNCKLHYEVCVWEYSHKYILYVLHNTYVCMYLI